MQWSALGSTRWLVPGLVVAAALSLPAASRGGELCGRVTVPSSVSARVEMPDPYPGSVAAAGASSKGSARRGKSLTPADAVISLVPVDPARVAKSARSPRSLSPSELPTLRQKDQAFVPRVLAVAAGTKVAFPNDDPFYHNVFSYSSAKRFDLGRYGSGKSKSVTFDQPGLVKVFCEIHSDMVGYIVVVSGDDFAMPAKDGAYCVDGVEPGEYDVTVWHPDLSEWTSRVTIPASGVAMLDIDMR
jgi:plastocyanin